MGKEVLLAEDERNIVESLTFVLARAGYTVSSAFDGVAALESARRSPPDAMILDLMLPRLSGFEVLKLLRGDAATALLPVLMLTAKGQAQDRRAAEELGVSAFLTKPFSNSEVLETIARLVGEDAA